MNIESLKEYVLTDIIEKKEYILIKNFCMDNKIELIDFFKREKEYNYSKLSEFFVKSFSKHIQDEEVMSYFFLQQDKVKNLNFKNILKSYNVISRYSHLLGYSKEEQLLLFIKEKNYEEILNFIKKNSEYKNHNEIKNFTVSEFIHLEIFEKEKIIVNQDSYNNINIEYNKTINDKENNPNFIHIDKFYEFIINNESKISFQKRKEYLSSIIEYGAKTVSNFKQQSLWDYVFIPLIHEKEFPELKEKDKFFSDLIKYKEQILSEEEPYNTAKIINKLSAKNKKELLLNFVHNYQIESYNYISSAIFNHFINEVSNKYIKDFFKLGIEDGYIFTYNMKEEYQTKYTREEQSKIINTNSTSLNNERVRENHEVIAKEILKKKHKYKTGVIDQFIKIDSSLIKNKEFILSLDNEEYDGLILELKEKNLPNITTTIMTLRLNNKLKIKGMKEKIIKI